MVNRLQHERGAQSKFFPLGIIKFILNLEKVAAAAAAASGFFHARGQTNVSHLFLDKGTPPCGEKKKSTYVTPKQDPEALNMPCLTFAGIQAVLLQQREKDSQNKACRFSHTVIYPNTLIFTVYFKR